MRAQRTSRDPRAVPRIASWRTKRLRAEPLVPQHRGELLRIHRDEAVGRALAGLRSEAWVDAALERYLEHGARRGFGIWMVYAEGELAGRVMLKEARIGGRDEMEIGYAFLPAFWGRGLATEAARALVWIAFSIVRLEEVVAFTLPDNHASRRVMEKAGLIFESEVFHADLPHVVYRRRRC